MSLIDDLKKVSRMNLDWDKMQNLDDDKGTEPYDIKSLSDFKNKWRFVIGVQNRMKTCL